MDERMKDNRQQLAIIVDEEFIKEFHEACKTQDVNASQAVRAFMREYIKKYGTTKEGKK